MDTPHLHLWKQSALRPEDCSASVWLKRSPARPTESDAGAHEDLRRAQRDARRSRAATTRGLVMSALLVMPVGGTFGWSTLSDGPRIADECQTLGSALPTGEQRRLRQYRVSNDLTPAQRTALNLRICDPTLIGMIPGLAKLVSDGAEFEDLAQRTKGVGEELNTISVLKALMASP